MRNSETNDTVTAESLQERLSELRTLWQTTKKTDSGFTGVSEDGEKVEGGNSGITEGVEPIPETPPALTSVHGFQPTKPILPPLRSPQLRHPCTMPMDAAMVSAPATGSCESVASTNAPFLPHTPSALSTGTPRARQKALQASGAKTPECAPVGTIALPPLNAHANLPL
ncbi:hypothetical protein ABL78_2374 [Leptomonas seymouri]|uniref:Uncharacterized protein n=1 Tax=Leptomonas seymouri TaxID=5684 RepID=A0A0N1PDA6_LEPSE|nr:hypothetical protein ABL78_2374 [Leptomonas seymouri]|eukprot:KPI88562.1 hypothetical protein ABL78_2374 [Leptomonas seymouri]